MSVKLVTGALAGAIFAVAVAASPALACKGATVLLQDDFTELDPAWDKVFGDFDVSGGKMVGKTEPGKIGLLVYGGSFFPGADACVDITAPTVRNPSAIQAGLGFWAGDSSYFMAIRPDGTAAVHRLTSDGWLHPVPSRKFDGIKSGPNAVNSLRVVWNAPPPRGSTAAPDPTVQFFINERPFIKFKAIPNSNRQLELYVESEGAAYQFSKLVVTR